MAPSVQKIFEEIEIKKKTKKNRKFREKITKFPCKHVGRMRFTTRMDPQGQGAPKVPSFLRSRACDNHPLILYFLKSCVFLSIILNLKLFHSRATVALWKYWEGVNFWTTKSVTSTADSRYLGKKWDIFKYFNILSKSFISQIFTALRKVVQLSSVCSIKIAQDEWLWWVPFGKY